MDPLIRAVGWCDGRPGHEAQVRGLAACIPARVDLLEIRLPDPAPKLERRLMAWTLAAKHLHVKPPPSLLADLLGEQWDRLRQFRPRLSLAAGRRGGLYSACFARIEWCATVQAMTHSVLGPSFTLNVIPAHDRPRGAANVVVTTTAANPYLPEVAAAQASAFFVDNGLDPTAVYWTLLLGGPPSGMGEETVDVDSTIAEITFLMRQAQEHGARLLVSTSRRTPPALADRLTTLLAADPGVVYWQDVRTDPRRTAGALIGAGQQVFLTPDSVSMVSEALWAGRAVTLLPLARTSRGEPVIPAPKHRRFLDALLAQEPVQWTGPGWQPGLVRTDPGYRHHDFLSIRLALQEVLRDAPPL